MDWGSVIGGGIQAAAGIGSALIGGNKSSGHSYQYYLDRDYNQSRRIAENQPSWLVQGAKNAGLHPLAVMGMPLTSGSSHSMGDMGGYQDSSWLNDVGQGIGRAAGALVDRKTRAQQEAYNEAKMGLDLENAKLQNELIQSNIKVNEFDMLRQAARDAERSINNQQQVPAFPVGRNGAVISGQGDSTTSSLFKVKPPELWANHPQTPFAEAGSHPEVKFTRTALGGYSPVRSQALEEALEDDYLGGLRYNIRNGLGSITSDPAFAPPREYLPDRGTSGRYVWMFDPYSGDWYPWDRNRRNVDKLVDVLPFGRQLRHAFK